MCIRPFGLFAEATNLRIACLVHFRELRVPSQKHVEDRIDMRFSIRTCFNFDFWLSATQKLLCCLRFASSRTFRWRSFCSTQRKISLGKLCLLVQLGHSTENGKTCHMVRAELGGPLFGSNAQDGHIPGTQNLHSFHIVVLERIL